MLLILYLVDAVEGNVGEMKLLRNKEQKTPETISSCLSALSIQDGDVQKDRITSQVFAHGFFGSPFCYNCGMPYPEAIAPVKSLRFERSKICSYACHQHKGRQNALKLDRSSSASLTTQLYANSCMAVTAIGNRLMQSCNAEQVPHGIGPQELYSRNKSVLESYVHHEVASSRHLVQVCDSMNQQLKKSNTWKAFTITNVGQVSVYMNSTTEVAANPTEISSNPRATQLYAAVKPKHFAIKKKKVKVSCLLP